MDFYKVNKQMVGHSVNVFVGLAELLLALRVVIEFFFTTAGGGFVAWVNYTTDTLLAPFRGVFPNPTHVPGNWYVDWVALFAMAVYMGVAYAFVGVATSWGAKRK